MSMPRNLRDTEAVAERDANLGGREALLCELADVVLHVMHDTREKMKDS